MAELWPGGPIHLPHTFVLDGDSFTVPVLDTGTLFGCLAYGAWWELVPNALTDDEKLVLAERLHDADPLEMEHLAVHSRPHAGDLRRPHLSAA